MMELKKIGVGELQYLAAYFLQNRNSVENVVADFGEIEKNNGYGTLFLKPKNALFKVFWIYSKDNRIMTVGFGGPNLGLSLNELYSVYTNYNEGFNRYDEEYVYVFYSSKSYKYTVKITSSSKLFEGEQIIDDVQINGIEIVLK